MLPICQITTVLKSVNWPTIATSCFAARHAGGYEASSVLGNLCYNRMNSSRLLKFYNNSFNSLLCVLNFNGMPGFLCKAKNLEENSDHSNYKSNQL